MGGLLALMYVMGLATRSTSGEQALGSQPRNSPDTLVAGSGLPKSEYILCSTRSPLQSIAAWTQSDGAGAAGAPLGPGAGGGGDSAGTPQTTPAITAR